MAAPYSYENTIRTHDEAIRTWLQKFRVDYGEINGQNRDNSPVITVFAAPHRAFAATVDQLVAQGWVTEADPAISRARATYEWPVLPLPIITIDRDDPIISNELACVPGEFSFGAFDEATGIWTPYPFPLHYLTQYRITVWSEKRYTHAHFMEWLLGELGHRGCWQRECLIPVVHAEPWGTMLQALRYQGSADLSDLEGFDARHIRSQVSFTLRTWFFKTVNPNPDVGPAVHVIGFDVAVVPPIDPPPALQLSDPSYVVPVGTVFEAIP